jgi:hypothetical protein
MKPLLALATAAGLMAQPARNSGTWTFALSGDSRNCGDLIMPIIAKRASAAGAKFYWHLGDLRALFKIDEDYAGLHRRDPAALTMDAYLKAAWDDFQKQQVAPFGRTPFFLGIGNHETIGRSNEQFIAQFRGLLDSEPIRRQREADDANDHTVRSYYHWVESGADFINLDNASSVFDAAQLEWVMKVLDGDEKSPEIKMIFVGMHESLPDSYSFDHSMNQGTDRGESGRKVYQRLLDLRSRTGKGVFVFSSHSHYYLANIYNTGSWQAKGVLPGWLVGTAGAQHYAIPPQVKSFTHWAENEYGYVLVHVTPGSEQPVDVQFFPIRKKDVDAKTVEEFGRAAVDFCFSDNWRVTLPGQP